MSRIGNLIHRFVLPRLSLRTRFEQIYEKHQWSGGGDETRSGAGSTVEATHVLRSQLPKLLADVDACGLLDVGCGDFNWMKEVLLPIRYMGVDIVGSVIEENRARYSADGISFSCLDATQEQLPHDYDFVICREVLFHLSFDDCKRVIRNIASTGAEFLLATTSLEQETNSDIVSGGFRNLNLQVDPFNFPEPERVLEDDSVSESRVLALWRTSALPKF